ncbi:TINF2 factor, partial [Atractosteus spatula]|nr:TINF2 factor [Atractosteus spatula]
MSVVSSTEVGFSTATGPGIAEQRCAQLVPDLNSWILEYVCAHKLLDVVKVLPGCSGVNVEELSMDSTLSVRVTAAALWSVMKNRDTLHYDRIIGFLDLIYQQIPHLVHFRHYIKISIGLKAKIVLHMFESNQPLLKILKKLNEYFPVNGAQQYNSTRRDIQKVEQCYHHFRRLVLRMIHNEGYRRRYIEEELEDEYGELFIAAVEKLLWEYLKRLESGLSWTKIDKLLTLKGRASSLTEGESLLADLLDTEPRCLPHVLQQLLQCTARPSSAQDPESFPSHSSKQDPDLRAALCEGNATSGHDRNAEIELEAVNQEQFYNSNEIDFSFGPQPNPDKDQDAQPALERSEPDTAGPPDQCTCQRFNLEPCRDLSKTGDPTPPEQRVLEDKIQASSSETNMEPEVIPPLKLERFELDFKEAGVYETEETPDCTEKGGDGTSYKANKPEQDTTSMTSENSNSVELICLGDLKTCFLVNVGQDRDEEDSVFEQRETETRKLQSPQSPTGILPANQGAPVFCALQMDSTSEELEETQSPPDPLQSQQLSQLNKACEYTDLRLTSKETETKESLSAEDCSASIRNVQEEVCSKRTKSNQLQESTAKTNNPGDQVVIENQHPLLRLNSTEVFATAPELDPQLWKQCSGMDGVKRDIPNLISSSKVNGKQEEGCFRKGQVYSGVRSSVESHASLWQTPVRLQPVVLLTKLKLDKLGFSTADQSLHMSSSEEEEEESHRKVRKFSEEVRSQCSQAFPGGSPLRRSTRLRANHKTQPQQTLHRQQDTKVNGAQALWSQDSWTSFLSSPNESSETDINDSDYVPFKRKRSTRCHRTSNKRKKNLSDESE